MLSFISIELIPNSHILSPKAGSRNEKDFLRRQVWKDKIFHSLSQNPMVTFFFFFLHISLLVSNSKVLNG